MKKQSRSTRRTNRARSVASASGLALILGLVNAAVGANVTDHIINPPTAQTDITITSTAPDRVQTLQFQNSSVTAPISNSPLFTSVPGTVANPNGSTITISANSLLAEAISNSSLQTFTVGTIPAGNDFSIATGQATALTAGSVVTASITDSPAQIAFSNSSNTITGNSIQADVTLNQSTATIDHDFVAGFGSLAAMNGKASASGDSSSSAPSTWKSDAEGNGVISNAQLAINSGGKTGSGALVTGSGVKVDATTNAMLPSDTITVTKNDIGTSYTGNEASSTYKGAGVNFDGSVAVSSLQLNQEDSASTATNPTAHVTNSGIAVTTGTHPIAGTVTVAQNNIAAQTTGNTAVNGAHVTATSVTGGNTAPTVSVDATVPGFKAEVGGAGATLALANAQRNNDAYLGSSIDGSHITVSGANGGGGAISVVNNDSQAAVMGNQAVNAAGLDATDIHGASTGIANTQVNGNTSMVASNATNVQVSSGTNQIAHSGAIVLDHNSIGSSAVGSAASNLTTIASDTDVLSTAGSAAFATLSKQRMHAASTTSATTTGNVQALLDNSVANTPVNATITHNTLASLAQGNSVANRTQIGSGAGSYGASVDNAQEFSENSSSSASTSSHLVGVTLKNSASPAASTVVVGDNALTAWANGNQAVNQLASTAGTTLDTGGGGHQLSNDQFMRGTVGATTHADYVGIDAQGGVAGQSDVLDNTLDATAIGNLADSTLALTAGTSLAITPAGVGLTNEQSTGTHNIVATTSGDVGVKASGVSNTSRISDANVLGNTLGATAIANQASNALGLTAGTTLSVNDASPELSNKQTSAAGVSASTSGDIGVQASTGPSFVSTSAISGDVNVLNNALDASAVANTASNTATLAALTMESGVNAALANNQSSLGSVAATTDGSFSIQATGTSSPLPFGSNTVSDESNVSDNALRAQAAGNQASNSLAMQAGTMLANVSATLTNDQTTRGAVTARSTGAAGILASGAAASNAISGNSSVSGNAFGSTALGNQAASTLALSTDAALATYGTALRNTQVLGAAVSASTTADVGIRAQGGSLSGINTVSGQSTVQDNALASAGTGNLATNVLALTGGTTLDVGTVGGGGDASLSSTQTAGSVTAGTEGGFGIQAAGNVGGGNTVGDDATVSGNTASADATGNRAANQLAMTAGTVLTGDGSLSNTQTANDAIHATTVVDVGITATGTALANTVSGNTSVLDNTSSSAATGNFANNELALQAGTLVAGDGSTLTNAQTTGTSAINASTSGGIGIVASAASGFSAVNTLSDNNTVSGNTMSSDAVANQAVNLLSMASDTTLNAGAGTQLSNTQTSDSAASAATEGGVGMQASGTGSVAGLVTGTASVLDNTLSARAGQNEAANTLRLDAGTLANAGTVNLSSNQEATGRSTATVTTNTDTVGIMATGTLGSLLGVATVTGNTLQSVAFANSATNLLAIDAATGNQSNASFANTQSNTGPVSATTTLGGSLGVDVGGTITGVVGSVVNVNDNQVGASAYGNSAANVLNANGGAGVPGYALAGTNTQTNTGAINAAINGPSGSGASIGLNTGTASSAYTANVLGNQVAAVAYGNTAYNQLTASSSVGMVPTSAALTSSQSNTANVTATVSNMGIGVVGSGSGGTGAGVAVISGNGVSATAVGNASVNHMVIGN